MRKFLVGFVCVAGCLAGCAFPLPSSGPGLIYTDAIEGLAVNNGIPEEKHGQVCALNILGIVSIGDISISEAMKKAEITQVATVDRTYFSVLGIYAKACTLVSGN